jgi:hypothetical protein
MRLPLFAFLGLSVSATLVATAACSSDDSQFGVLPGTDASVTATMTATTNITSDGATTCTGLACNVPKCEAGKTTTIEGDVYDPARKNKIYNVLAYIPSAPLEPLKEGPTCETCAAVPSGKPISIGITDEKGHFKLEGVPAGERVPLVIQVGKWRRELVIPKVEACAANSLPDKTVSLPKNSKEGHIPKMAVVAGGFDDLPCVLRNIGIDESEFSAPDGDGQIHIYTGATGGRHTGSDPTYATELWGAPAKGGKPAVAPSLTRYDQVVLTCEGAEYTTENPAGQSVLKSPEARTAMRDYLNAGGRVFAEHYQLSWFRTNSDADVKGIASWKDPPGSTYGMTELDVDVSFPKGQAFASWLQEAAATNTKGKLPVKDFARNITKVTAGKAQGWLKNGTESISYVTVNMPVGKPEAEQCGRAALTDLEVSGQLLGNVEFPKVCVPHDLTPQEKAFEFFFFDLAACVLSDAKAPEPPPIR